MASTFSASTSGDASILSWNGVQLPSHLPEPARAAFRRKFGDSVDPASESVRPELPNPGDGQWLGFLSRRRKALGADRSLSGGEMGRDVVGKLVAAVREYAATSLEAGRLCAGFRPDAVVKIPNGSVAPTELSAKASLPDADGLIRVVRYSASRDATSALAPALAELVGLGKGKVAIFDHRVGGGSANSYARIWEEAGLGGRGELLVVCHDSVPGRGRVARAGGASIVSAGTAAGLFEDDERLHSMSQKVRVRATWVETGEAFEAEMPEMEYLAWLVSWQQKEILAGR